MKNIDAIQKHTEIENKSLINLDPKIYKNKHPPINLVPQYEKFSS